MYALAQELTYYNPTESLTVSLGNYIISAWRKILQQRIAEKNVTIGHEAILKLSSSARWVNDVQRLILHEAYILTVHQAPAVHAGALGNG